MQGFSLWACVLQEAGAPSAAGAGQSWPAEAPVTAVVNVGDYHGYQRLEALTVRGRAEGCPLPALSHMAASGKYKSLDHRSTLPGAADLPIISH